MPIDPHIPTLAQLDDAPQRAILHTLAVCACCAQRTLEREHPSPLEPPDHLVPVNLAANLLLRYLSSLRETLALYEATLIAASHLDNCDPDLPF
jgi:hypothetical protein